MVLTFTPPKKIVKTIIHHLVVLGTFSEKKKYFKSICINR